MPYAIVRTKHGFGVKNRETGHLKSKDTSKAKAEGQRRLLAGLEHGMKARRK